MCLDIETEDSAGTEELTLLKLLTGTGCRRSHPSFCGRALRLSEGQQQVTAVPGLDTVIGWLPSGHFPLSALTSEHQVGRRALGGWVGGGGSTCWASDW